jgi:hypothetical protein
MGAPQIFNFLAIAFEKEIDPYPCPDDPAEGPCLQQYKATWVTLDDICNWIFLCELILNYYGAGLRRFWTSGWNVFDFIVVFVGVLTLIRVPLGPFSQLKMLRAFRVFRLFKRIKSLNKIIVALLNAIPGVTNAFVIMVRTGPACGCGRLSAKGRLSAVGRRPPRVAFARSAFGPAVALPPRHYTTPTRARPRFAHLLSARPGLISWPISCEISQVIFMSIYAILAVDFFRDFGQGYEDFGGRNAYTTLQGNPVEGALQTNISAMTARGYSIGDEYYGTFSRALYTLFQVMTGESWSEAIARPLVFGWNSPYGSVFVGIYYTSFILLTQIVLVNVVVAVLLDKFVEDPDKDGDDAGEEGEEAEDATATSTTKDGGVFGGDAKPITDAAAVSFQMASTMATPEGMAELAARVQGVEAKLDQVLSLLKALDKKGGPSA